MTLPLGLKPTDIVRGAASLAQSFSTAVPGPWGVALTWLSAGASLAADIADHAMDPVIMIEEMRSILPPYRDAQARLRNEIAAMAARGHV